jgi:LPS O-antigen subunit length determinant protein (WzzB/FepE family)
MDATKVQETSEARIRGIPGRETLPQIAEVQDRRRRVDLGDVLARWKILIMGAALLGAVAALIGSFFAREIFESRTVIQIGQTIGVTQASTVANPLLELPEALIERLKEEYRVGDSSEGDAPLPSLKDARVNRSAKMMVVLTAHGETSASAQAFLAGVAHKIVDEHRLMLDRSLTAAKDRLESVERQLKVINQQVANLSARVADVGKRDVASAVILTAERGELMEQLLRLEHQRYELASSMKDARPSVIVRTPTLPLQRAAPARSIYVLTGALIGLIIGFFLAVFLHRRHKLRPR